MPSSASSTALNQLKLLSVTYILILFPISCSAFHLRHSRELQEEDESREYSAGEIISFATIPIIAALVGMGTNWLALKMTFYPTYFFGVKLLGKYSRIKDQPAGCIGWQGIVPTKAAKMAAQSVDLMTTKVFDIKEIFGRIEKDKAALHLKEGFETSISEIVDKISNEFVISEGTSWKTTESMVKTRLQKWALDRLPAFSEGFMGDLVENLDDVYDLKDMCVTEMVANPQLLNDIFESVGKKELIFIRNSGAYFGFPFGIIQMLVFFFVDRADVNFNAGILLPIFGVLVGLATNYIALYMIFKPIEPRKINLGCTTVTLQGLFLKRQKEASISFARRIVGTVLHSENIWKHMLNGPKKDAFRALLDKHVEEFTDNMIGYARPLVKAYLGDEEFKKMREIVRVMSQDKIEDIIVFMHEYTDEALDLENEIATKMGALPSREFEQVLHPVFEEDELKLILVGGVLGALVGLFQWLVIFENTQ